MIELQSDERSNNQIGAEQYEQRAENNMGNPDDCRYQRNRGNAQRHRCNFRWNSSFQLNKRRIRV
jgi:hypothetical protein